MLKPAPSLDLQQWHLTFQMILPTPAEGTAAFEVARNVGQTNVLSATEVLTEYKNYLLRGAVPLTEAQLGQAVNIAKRYRASLRDALANPDLLGLIELMNVTDQQI